MVVWRSRVVLVAIVSLVVVASVVTTPAAMADGAPRTVVNSENSCGNPVLATDLAGWDDLDGAEVNRVRMVIPENSSTVHMILMLEPLG